MPLKPGHWSRRQIVRCEGLLDVTLFIVSLFLFSDGSQQTACKVGWFGSVCQYKCRCTNDTCGENGLCLGKGRCVGGWFGPACQYVDLAYNQTSNAEITDGNDETCIYAKNINRVVIVLNTAFTWLRIRGVINDLRVRLKQQGYNNPCRNATNATVDDLTLDIHCPSNDTVQEVHIYWFEASQLCSIYVSGGRNVALKQNATQSSTYYDPSDGGENQTMSYPSELAVDGCLDPLSNLGRACSRTQPDAPEEGVLNIRLSQSRVVNRFVITIGFGEFSLFTNGLTLELFNDAWTKVYEYTGELSPANMLYNSTFMGVIAVVVKITSNRKDKVLNICEFELYGDSSCPHGQFGRECEKTCKCLKKEDCFVSTGGCPSGCSSGYLGEDCNTPCDNGTHGVNCLSNCSQFCDRHIEDNGVCDPVDGSCLGECMAGYQAPACLSICTAGKYGPGCKLACSPHCFRRNESTEPLCDRIDGVCILGCSSGYRGHTCNISCETNKYGIDCKHHCSKGCLPGQDPHTASCHHVTGACVNGCYPGYNGTLCVQKFVTLESATVSQDNSRLVVIGVMSTLGVVFCLAMVYLLFCVKKDRHLSTEEQDNISRVTS